MLDATRKTKLARAVAAWTLRCAHSGAALVGVAVLGLAVTQLARHGVEGLQPAHLAADLGLKAAEVAPQDAKAEAELAQAVIPPARFELPVASISTVDGVVRYICQKYKVSDMAVTPVVAAAHQVGRSMGVDPMLILAVMAIESRFNPFAQSAMGAQGLMQVIPRYHHDKLEKGETRRDFVDPGTNIRVGALVLKEAIAQAGSVRAGLQRYAGDADDPAQGYANKVMAEKARLMQAQGQHQRASRELATAS